MSELRSRWGWHRLADGFARELVAGSGVGRGALVLDLGAGDGAITRHLVAAGARVIAFELHPERAATLRATFPERTVKVVRADVADLRLPTRDFHVVANPPFAVISPVLRRLTHRHSRLVRADIVVPRVRRGTLARPPRPVVVADRGDGTAPPIGVRSAPARRLLRDRGQPARGGCRRAVTAARTWSSKLRTWASTNDAT